MNTVIISILLVFIIVLLSFVVFLFWYHDKRIKSLLDSRDTLMALLIKKNETNAVFNNMVDELILDVKKDTVIENQYDYMNPAYINEQIQKGTY